SHSHGGRRRITERRRCRCRRFLRSRATKKLRACVGHPTVCAVAVIENVGHSAAARKTVSLFSKLPLSAEPDVPAANQPLAQRMRPRTLDEFIGQEKLLGPGKPLRVQIESENLGSMLFWGPPGCGKTTLARLIARLTR